MIEKEPASSVNDRVIALLEEWGADAKASKQPMDRVRLFFLSAALEFFVVADALEKAMLVALRQVTVKALKFVIRRKADHEVSREAVELSPPIVGELLVTIFTPAKHRESAILEMQLGFELVAERYGRTAAWFAYWWELARNLFAFVGGWKTVVAIAAGGTAVTLSVGVVTALAGG